MFEAIPCSSSLPLSSEKCPFEAFDGLFVPFERPFPRYSDPLSIIPGIIAIRVIMSKKINMLTVQHLFSLSCVSAQLRRCALQYSSAGTLSCSLSFTANLFIANICCVFSSNVQSKCTGLRDFSSLIIDKSPVHCPGLIFPRGRNCYACKQRWNAALVCATVASIVLL